MSDDLTDLARIISGSCAAGIFGLISVRIPAKDSLDKLLTHVIPVGCGACITGVVYGMRPGLLGAAAVGATAGLAGYLVGRRSLRTNTQQSRFVRDLSTLGISLKTYGTVIKLVRRAAKSNIPIIVPITREPAPTLAGSIYIFHGTEVLTRHVHPSIGQKDEHGNYKVEVIVERTHTSSPHPIQLAYTITTSQKISVLCAGSWDLERKIENAHEAYREQVRQHYRKPSIAEVTPLATQPPTEES